MMPLEFFPPTLVTVAHVTPHAWAVDGFAELIRHDGTLTSVLTELGVLALYATVLLVLGSLSMQRRILRG
jgi:ABC-2 type transport system permease protein